MRGVRTSRVGRCRLRAAEVARRACALPAGVAVVYPSGARRHCSSCLPSGKGRGAGSAPRPTTTQFAGAWRISGNDRLFGGMILPAAAAPGEQTLAVSQEWIPDHVRVVHRSKPTTAPVRLFRLFEAIIRTLPKARQEDLLPLAREIRDEINEAAKRELERLRLAPVSLMRPHVRHDACGHESGQKRDYERFRGLRGPGAERVSTERASRAAMRRRP